MAAHRAFMASRMVQINPMVYSLLQGHISDHIALQAHGEVGNLLQESPEMQQQAQMDPQGFKIQFDSMVAKRIAEITTALAQEEAGGQKQDPLVALKQRELDLRAMDMQRKAQENMEAEERKAGEFEERIDLDKMKLESAEDQAGERIRIAEEKINLNREKQNESKQQKS
jgi:thioester reductase-like protein